MRVFYTLYIWLVVMIQTFKSDLPAQTEEEKAQPLRLDLQFFADDPEDNPGDDPEDDPDDEDPEDDSLNLAELMKDPAFKKQYNQKLKEQLGKRMKKFEGVDPEEYKRLKATENKKNGKGSDDEDDKSRDDEQQKRFLRAERREKKAVVKEFAIDNGHNPKLLARLLDIDAIELDEDGEPENLDDLFDELEADFPEYFGTSDDDQEESGVKKKSFTPGSKQKGNKKKKIDPYAAGAERAKQRHSKGDDK
ncbi:hypothetical protein [Sporosarcina sp. A2]|uniref:phage scaffolding protein n=1 Tax=Sporosarcina sp. A2 TaxID=3393449 RepID=UPI003D7A5C37